MKKFLCRDGIIALCLIMCFLIVYFNVNNSSTLSVSSDDVNTPVKVLILMYHSFTDGGKESQYVLDAKKLDEDIAYLKGAGFEFVDTSGLIAYSEGKKKTKNNLVMLSFDDGYLNNYLYALPVLKKHGVRAVISPIACCVEKYQKSGDRNPVYAHINKDDITLMHQSGYIDFQNHSYNMHSQNPRHGSAKSDGEDRESYIREFFYDLQKAENILEPICNKKLTAYAYPFGDISRESLSVLKLCGYKMSFSCYEGINYISNKKDELYNLKRFNRTPQRSAGDIVNLINSSCLYS